MNCTPNIAKLLYMYFMSSCGTLILIHALLIIANITHIHVYKDLSCFKILIMSRYTLYIDLVLQKLPMFFYWH